MTDRNSVLTSTNEQHFSSCSCLLIHDASSTAVTQQHRRCAEGFYWIRLFFHRDMWIRLLNTLTLLTAVSHAAKLVWDVSVEAGGDECPGQKRFETESECRRADRWVSQWGKKKKKGVKALLVICHSLSAYKMLQEERLLPAFQYLIFHKQGSAEDFCFLRVKKKTCFIIKVVHGLLKNTDARAKEELRQTKAVENVVDVLRDVQPLLCTSCSLPGK